MTQTFIIRKIPVSVSQEDFINHPKIQTIIREYKAEINFIPYHLIGEECCGPCTSIAQIYTREYPNISVLTEPFSSLTEDPLFKSVIIERNPLYYNNQDLSQEKAFASIDEEAEFIDFKKSYEEEITMNDGELKNDEKVVNYEEMYQRKVALLNKFAMLNEKKDKPKKKKNQ